jgi:hypothetical protein
LRRYAAAAILRPLIGPHDGNGLYRGRFSSAFPLNGDIVAKLSFPFKNASPIAPGCWNGPVP